MSSFLHHHHKDLEKPSEQSPPAWKNANRSIDNNAHHHHHLFGHHKDGEEKTHHRPSQAEIDNAEFAAAKHYDHALKSSHGPGVGFEGGRQG
ncbi:hypothetical protein N7526_004968 [Penicillium atrosanguineum]|nr:hypothetical protein N7526_004968 [Penicillium atrosanguineum]